MAKTAPKSTARDVFLYLLMIVTLYIGVVGFLTIIFQLINSWLPDPFQYYSSINTALRYGISSVIIVMPIFYFVSWVLERDLKKHKEKSNLRVRKWLLYLTLFVAAITMIIDLITLLNQFLGGDLTGRFFLKTLAVLVVAAAIFGYYLWALKVDTTKYQTPKIMAWVSGAVILIFIAIALFTVGSPQRQRAIRFDEERLSHLDQIQSQISFHWQSKGELPASIDSIATGIGEYQVPTDPETGAQYEYRVISDLTFELCASFNFASQEARENPRISYLGTTETSWDHEAGRDCFERTIDPDFFKDTAPRFPEAVR